MHPRSVAAIALIVALVAGGLVVVPGLSAGALPYYVGLTTMPDTVDGIPLDEAPPRTVVVVDRLALARGDLTPIESVAAEAGRSTATTAQSTTGSTATGTAGLGARTMSHEVVVDPEALSEQDRELFDALGLLDADDLAAADSTPTPDPADPADQVDEVDANDPVDPPVADPVELDDATVATLLAARIADHLGVEVEVESVIGDRFTVVGSGPEALSEVPGIAAAEEAALGMLFADAPSLLFHDQWALLNTGQDVSERGTDGPGIQDSWHRSDGRLVRIG